MSRTRLAALTALGLVLLSVAVFFTRRATGGVDAGPSGLSAWEVTFTVRGEFPAAKADARLTLATPPDFRRQHVFDASARSDELTRPEGRAGTAKGPRELTTWNLRPGAGRRYELAFTFHVVLGTHEPSKAMRTRTNTLDKAPPDADKDPTPTRKPSRWVQSEHPVVKHQADTLAANRSPPEQVRAFFDRANTMPFKKTARQSALDALQAGGADALGKSRLMAALCRARKIPARVVTGLVLNPNAPPAIHHWVEAWTRTPDQARPHWLPADPTYGHFGFRGWPTNYLVVRLDDRPIASGSGEERLSLFARRLPNQPAGGDSRLAGIWRAVSLTTLPTHELHLVRFLVLLPLAAVVVSVFRVVIGTRTFGVFSPALLGLVFRDLRNLPWGLGIFVGIVLVGWLFRKVLDRYHLLLIPRTSVLLTLIVGFLLVVVVASSRYGVHVTSYLALFPLIILTHMVERFWTLEAEDGTSSSFRTLLGTVFVSAVVALSLSPEAVARWMVRYPETLGCVVAVLLLLGRYTGYRLTELYRFQDVIEFSAKDEGGGMKGESNPNSDEAVVNGPALPTAPADGSPGGPP